MKTHHWIIGFVAIFALKSFFATGDQATETYLKQCFDVIDAGSKKANDAWTTHGKMTEMRDAFVNASDIKPPDGADQGAVVRMKQVLKEGIECFDSADSEVTWIRDFTLGFLGGLADASGGSGLATTTLFTAKGAEMANDESERREFVAAVQELERYLSDKK